MYLPESFSTALVLTVLTAVFWGSWANAYKGTKDYPFALFYWDYILGVLLCAFTFAFTLGSNGASGEAFIANLRHADPANCWSAVAAGAIFNVANLLLVAALDIAGLAIAFPIAIGIAVVEGVVLSYAIQPKGDVTYLAPGVALAVAAVIFNARAYRALGGRQSAAGALPNASLGIVLSVVSGLLMGAYAPFVTSAMTRGHTLTPYSVGALFSVGAFLCCFVANTYFMRHPPQGKPASFSGFWRARPRNHALGIAGGLVWGMGGCLNFIAASFVGVPISYAIGQSAPLIAAGWGIFVWHEFKGAPRNAWANLGAMAVCYVAAIGLIALAYTG